jgi:hypothetical protein
MNWLYHRTSSETGELTDELHCEIDAIGAMPEDDVCVLYNVDCRDEAIDAIKYELGYLEEEHERALEAEEKEDARLRRLALASTPMERAYVSFGF